MKLHRFLILAVATLLPAQAPGKGKPPAGKPVPASSSATTPAASVHGSLADLERDFQQRKLSALDAYVKASATRQDNAEAILEAVALASTLERPDDVLRFANLYLQKYADGEAQNQMHIAQGNALRDKGDFAGAQSSFEYVIEHGGEDVQMVVESAKALAAMLVDTGKKDEAIELLGVVGASHSGVRGLKEHLAGICAEYELIGTEPKALGQNDILGKPIDLAEYKGKVVMLDFWATWCGPCKAELPNVIAAYEKYHAKGFEIVGISLDEDRAAFDKFIVDSKMTWRHHYDGKGWKNEVAVEYGVQSIPATYLIGPDGKIVAIGLRGEQLVKRLATLLGGAKAAATKGK
jgi:thiol-disulfide isomerase/thioredoxin